MMTLRASQTKSPPMMSEVISVLVRMARAARAAPRASEPVSPMKIDAGLQLCQRKPTQAPAMEAAKMARLISS